MFYDFICLGGGNFAKYLEREATKINLKTLVVTNQNSYTFQSSISYDKFFQTAKDIESKYLVISSRFDRFDTGLFEVLSSFMHQNAQLNLGVKIFLSSVAVYPSSKVLMQEDCANPETDYGFSKLAIEKSLNSALEGTLINLRVSNLFGSDGLSRLESNIAKSVASKKPITISSSIALRDFVYVGDLTSFLFDGQALLIEPGTYNFASGISSSIEEFILTWLTGEKVALKKKIEEPTILHSVIDNRKLLKATNFKFTPLIEGVALARKNFA